MTIPIWSAGGYSMPASIPWGMRQERSRDARLILYEGKGHAPTGKQFGQDVLAFLTEGMKEDT